MWRRTLAVALVLASLALVAWFARAGCRVRLAGPELHGIAGTRSAAVRDLYELEAAQEESGESVALEPQHVATDTPSSRVATWAQFPCRGEIFRWLDGRRELCPGAELRLALEVHGEETWFTQLVSTDGTFDVPIPAEGLRSEDLPVVVVLARVPRHLPARIEQSVTFRAGSPSPLRIDTSVGLEAPVLSGRVVDANGDPATNAAIEVWRVDVPEPVREFGPETDGCMGYVDDSDTNDSGEYAVQVTPGGVYRVAARSATAGVGGLAAMRVDEADVALPDLELRGTGELAGHAVQADGEPAGRVALHLRLAEPLRLADGTSVGVGPWGVEPGYALLELAGNPSAEAVTDEEGYFRFVGLGSWSYELSTRSGLVVTEGAGPHRAGTRDVRVVVDSYVVRVRVVGADGSDPYGAQLAVREWSDPSAETRATLHSAELHHTPRKQAASASHVLKKTHWWTYVRPGEAIRFDACAPGYRPAFAAVEIAPETRDYAITLTLEKHAGGSLGHIALELSDFPYSRPPRVELTSIATGIDHARQRQLYSWPKNLRRREFEVPAGAYRLRVFSTFAQEPVFPFEERVEIAAGRTLALRPAFEFCSSLRVEGVLLPRLTDPVSAELSWHPDEGAPLRSTVPLSSGSAKLLWYLRVLEPGSGRLRAEVPGRAPVEQRLELQSGAMSEVVLRVDG